MAERLIVFGFFEDVIARLAVAVAGRPAAGAPWPPSSRPALTWREARELRGLARRADVPRAASARRFDVDGHRLAVVRIGDDWYAIGDRCSHAEASLAEGEVWPDECEIECPKHGSAFSLKTGEP